RAARDLPRAVQRARPEVEDPRRGPQPLEQPPDRLLPPDHVHARGHHAVGGVVSVRDPIEHRSDVRAGLREARAHSPRSFQMAFTRWRTSGRIFRTSGHSRVKPSSFHLRVASTPSLPPNPKPAEAWSSTSMGPSAKNTSRLASMLFSARHA